MTEITKKKYIAEIICFILFITGTIFISIYHEPWHDEFQAWGISKDTLNNILFTVPHYEGHPPLWHLILKCFSSFDINPEWGLRIPNLLFMYGAVFLLIFKSPFPKALRLILPFTYFIFYQYAIVSRPYSIFCFALFLAAVFYKERNEHPYRYITALCLLCLSCAYGMVFAAGITAVWVIEILKEHLFSGGRTGLVDMGNKIENKKISPRIKAILLIILLCIILTAVIFPADDVYYSNIPAGKVKFLYTVSGILCDSLLSNITYEPEHLKSFSFWCCILSGIIYVSLFFIFRYYKSLMLFFIPYIMFISVCGLLYVYGHHTGLLTLFIVFVFWCSLSGKSKTMTQKYKIISCVLIMIPVCIQLQWSACAYKNEYKHDYWFSRAISKYIKENNLDRYTIMGGWIVNPKPKIINGRKVYEYNFLQQTAPVSIIPYFKKNIFYNFNNFFPNKEYIVMSKPGETENAEIIEEWKKYGLPGIIFGYPTILSLVFSYDELKNQYYEKLYIFVFQKTWKNETLAMNLPIYAREDIYNKIMLSEKQQFR